MAGVPMVARAMFEAVAPTLRTGKPVYSQAVDAHISEGDIAEALVRIQDSHPGVAVGSYPYFRDNKLGTSIVARGTEKAALASVIAQVAEAMRKLGADPVFGPVP